MKHLGILTTSFPTRQNPGSGIFVSRLVDELARSVSVTVITPDATYDDGFQETGYPVLRFRYAPRRLQLISHQSGGIPVMLRQHRWLHLLLPLFLGSMFLACLRLSRRVDLIHANWAACGAIAGLAGWLARTPVISTLRGSDVARIQDFAVDRLLLSICLRTNAAVVCVSEAIRDAVGDLYPAYRDRLSCIPNGVGNEFLCIEHRASPSSRIRFLAIANLIPLKAIDLAIRAFSKATVTNSELLIIGDGPEKERLTELIHELNLADQVFLQGRISPENIPAELAKADALVLTSKSEGRPNVILEAMAAGLPVVATRIDGVRELLIDGHTGMLFDSGSIDQLADRMRRLATDSALRLQLGASARQSVLDKGLTWSNATQAYLQLYHAVAP